ncbi:RNA polymerase II transcriptional coactivator KELP-like [Juglans microcarpa x Juglans regia]|uniref:RNA polymerase II transcriptional coactivator KELP-like n=1 Tax=Juglans microcarpa x Juglans regia TaxID=2249226 RepID=UPI001B7DA8FB|nr:RNA polymerase II transcriptional coactivator KELP-like [Juglans microcarpa x Juglans regia]
MEPEIQERIENTVRRILKGSDMEEMTEHKIRKQASAELDLDLSEPPYKAFVKQIVQSFLEQQVEEEEEEVEEERGERRKEYDDDGDLIICRLSEKRRVTIQDFRGKTLVSIREYYKKDGKELPTSKGISLTEEQWSAFKKNVPDIEKAIRKMESRIM